jgi:hypothetical protein
MPAHRLQVVRRPHPGLAVLEAGERREHVLADLVVLDPGLDRGDVLRAGRAHREERLDLREDHLATPPTRWVISVIPSPRARPRRTMFSHARSSCFSSPIGLCGM